ncbi:5-methyltetrahydropteroyltriglutamate--homocysteine S-methyltransferase [Campylobacter sp. VicNov18]|uniref:5-methyltetrahydropteroyltriglutamate-- homocysteine S-methyltransferase n=1 Tax=Campylobacter bilis TaxID=2691918 RepID=UPI00130D7288|nr:5-methyltetrahydropteroyltriglutamate--homocysteine S-methyltransferase [Campylobacter bilis]MPV63175.1 5-methyltetrahydropteroyltriglutamate--homocysteine S-methyltransferase [Campylobacter hepaticus]MBM0636675.1 5-methyltetrahydropteroyltriglutamate--homocysteine S-methyltransferase [Campylobacter bilis]MCC8277519.1 5-methyltetrahydropteroyltriglutamate--homocysteine S-methyltransferase [Campylobacter bilis]MCC8298724.1 5-methyltetrahydropteroyltriglutamate--homocysteine S-methyltransferas
MKNSIISYPRIGANRELKFGVEKYFKNQSSKEELLQIAKNLRTKHWQEIQNFGIDFIPSNDFSFYDNVLDAAVLFNIIHTKYKNLNLEPLDEYFAQSRGYQGKNGDTTALAMKKWFNTNYHYLVPECDDANAIALVGDKIFKEYLEAKELGIETKPVLIGIFTLFKLINFKDEKTKELAKEKLLKAYEELLTKLNTLKVQWLQFDEPYLVYDLDQNDLALFDQLYTKLLNHKQNLKILLQTYFGDVRDIYPKLLQTQFDGLGLDFIEGKESLKLIEKYGFAKDKILFAGIINGKNIYANDYTKSLKLIKELQKHTKNIVLNTSCSLLHVPYSTEFEKQLNPSYLKIFSFAKEKLKELKELKEILNTNEENPLLKTNQELFQNIPQRTDEKVKARLQTLKKEDFIRQPEFKKRILIQKEFLQLPLLPTTTIGSFPQSADVRSNRLAFKQEKISATSYTEFNQQKIKECIAIQEEIGLDVLVHGEFERNDMVEYFGENLKGFLFTQNGWVQSYGTRCVKPPVIWGDVSRIKPITLAWAKFAQSLSKKIVKGMLTGPVTILNWSFPREDISLKESAQQIALALRDEVLDLENAGIKIIQIDEAALREKLPLRKSDWHSQYLDWAIPAFNLVHSGVKTETQIHTHMCYSEFNDILKEIDAMDADVISFEASRSNLSLLDTLKAIHFQTEVGPGVYDIHSPRVPSVEELSITIKQILNKLPKKQIWINPDCGLKTRSYEEVIAALKNLVIATQKIRESL